MRAQRGEILAAVLCGSLICSHSSCAPSRRTRASCPAAACASSARRAGCARRSSPAGSPGRGTWCTPARPCRGLRDRAARSAGAGGYRRPAAARRPEWQFWQRGCWSTVCTTAKAASWSAARREIAWRPQRDEHGNAKAHEVRHAVLLMQAGAAAGAAACRSARTPRWRPPARSAACRLADAAHLRGARHDVDLDLRHLVHAQHRVVVEVALLDPAVLRA